MRPWRRPDGDSLMVLCPTPPLAAAAEDNVVNDWIANARAASSSGSRSAREPRSSRRSAVHKSNCRGASPPRLNHDLQTIDATPARWRGRGLLSPLDSASSVAFSPRRDLVKNYQVHPTH